jgi:hypothetical protein
MLGVEFDPKLQQSVQVSNAIEKAKEALHAIMLIEKYFNRIGLKQILTAKFYSIICYNMDI